MDDKDKKIAKLERDLLITRHQLLELDKVKHQLASIHRSRIWRLREMLFARHLNPIQRIDMLLNAIPGISFLYKKSHELYLHLTSTTIQNTKVDGPLISVVIPFFNYMNYIDDCVNSINNQGLGDRVEVIIVEGMSTDGSREEIKAKSWPNTRVVFQETKSSIGENRLRGIEESRGRYICMLDADDMLAEGYFKHAIRVLEEEYYDIVYPDIKYFEEEDREHDMPEFYYDNIFEFNTIPTPSIFRKSFWEENHIGYSTSRQIFEDWDFWMRMAKAGARIKHIEGFYHLYRVHTTTTPSMTDLRLKEQQNKDETTRAPFQSFVHSKEFYKGRRRQNSKFKVINPDINRIW